MLNIYRDSSRYLLNNSCRDAFLGTQFIFLRIFYFNFDMITVLYESAISFCNKYICFEKFRN